MCWCDCCVYLLMFISYFSPFLFFVFCLLFFVLLVQSIHFGRKIPESDKEGLKTRKTMQLLRTILRDAHQRKMHALLSTLSVDTDTKIVEAHWEEMQRWCDVKGKECELVQYRYALWKKEQGLALKTLLSMVENYDGKKHLVGEEPLRLQLLQMYEMVGWEFLVDNEKRYQQMHYPKL